MRSANWQMFHAKIHEYMNPIWASSPVQSVRQWSNARHPVGTKNPSGRDGVMTCLVFAPLHPTIKPSNLSKSIWKQIFSSCHRCQRDNLKVFFLSMFHMFHFYFLTLGWNWGPQAWPDCHSTSSWDEVLLPDSNEASLRKSTGWWWFFS